MAVQKFLIAFVVHIIFLVDTAVLDDYQKQEFASFMLPVKHNLEYEDYHKKPDFIRSKELL